MAKWQSTPQLQVTVTHSAVDYVIDVVGVTVRRHENGFDTASVTFEDTDAQNYSAKVSAENAIKIEEKDSGDAAYTTIFNGVIRRVDPIASKQGNLLLAECDGAGYGLMMTVCGEEYGTQSNHASLDTIREVLKDATDGVIPIWVNKLLGTATNTGYAYTTYIEDIAGTLPYFYFPYKPNNKVVNDICDVVQAIKGTNAGPHWIVDTSSRFLLTTIGSHSAAGDNPAQYWPTWWRTDQDGSTLVEGEDFVNFRFQELAPEANYVLYHGRWQWPPNKDYATETGTWDCDADSTVAYSAAVYKVNAKSLQFTVTNATPFNDCWYPDSQDLALELDMAGGQYNIPSFNVWMYRNATLTNQYLWIQFKQAAAAYYLAYVDLNILLPSDSEWQFLSFPVGPYWRNEDVGGAFLGIDDAGGDWNEVNWIQFSLVAPVLNSVLYIDGMNFQGWALRGARQNAAYSSSDPAKIKIITDDVAKDDSLIASDDSGLMARLAYAEYLRQSSTPIVGSFTTPMANDILPGQKIHIHAKKYGSGIYRINKDFRVTRPVHQMTSQGALTSWDVTDDLKNANPRPIPTQFNALLSAVRPEFQDRQATSIKTREIDITQAILEKSY